MKKIAILLLVIGIPFDANTGKSKRSKKPHTSPRMLVRQLNNVMESDQEGEGNYKDNRKCARDLIKKLLSVKGPSRHQLLKETQEAVTYFTPSSPPEKHKEFLGKKKKTTRKRSHSTPQEPKKTLSPRLLRSASAVGALCTIEEEVA